ncbi:MAG: nitronate monooxygenase, partial [Lapillicoccus sp.]
MTEPDDPTADVLQTRACALFGVRYPIVQTGMGWVSDAHLTAATANAGALGILSSVLLTLDELA